MTAKHLAFALVLLVVGLAGCRRTTRWESVCQIIRRDVVEKDDKGAPLVVDFELEWDPCPGDQLQVVRGGQDFAACTAKYKVGEYVPVRVVRWWDTRGFYKWDIYQLGDCVREVDERAEGSFEKSQECEDTKAYGRANGFHCSKKPDDKLVEACPWMARQ